MKGEAGMSNPGRDWTLNFERKHIVSLLRVHVGAFPVGMALLTGIAMRLNLNSPALSL